jgi:ubiquinone/menaquinone biosynthesis C-methylase UbiE
MSSARPTAIPAQGVLVDMVMGGWRAKILAEISALDVADVLHRLGPATSAELVQQHGVKADPEALERCLRACAAMGIFSEDVEGRFGPTAMSEPLTTNSMVSVKKLVACFGSNAFYRGFTGLTSTIQTGKPNLRDVLGMEWWDYLNANPQELELFGEAMESNSMASLNGVLKGCDFSSSRKIADIGGGFGHLAVALLEKYPHLRGVVLDVPALIPIAKERMKSKDDSVASRLEYIGGNMFISLPPADTYIFKHIIHDWDDDHCVRVLRNCRNTMQGDGRIICIDSIVPPMGDSGGLAAKVTDIVMMSFIAGKERTKGQWEHLYKDAGFRISAITPLTDNIGTSIIEGVKSHG